MSGESSTGVAGRADALSLHAREDEIRATKEQVARWAQALVPHVGAQPPPVLLGEAPVPDATAALRPGNPTADWRGGDGALTLGQAAPTAQATSANAGAGGGENDCDRLLVSIKTADLGELSLVLDRGENGVRVVIGVEGTAAAERLTPERDALVRQLLGSGLTVQSVQIVNQSEVGQSARSAAAAQEQVGQSAQSAAAAQKQVGTVLAEPRSLGKNKFAENLREAEPEAGKERRRNSRKLNLIG